MQQHVRRHSPAIQAAIDSFLSRNAPIVCAAGSTACRSIDVATNAVQYKPVIYFSRSASRQLCIASSQRGIKAALASANRVIYLPAT